MPWHYNGITTAMQEEKRKEKKEQWKQFCFFSDEKNKIGNLKVTEWGEIIASIKAPIYSDDYSVRVKIQIH